ncbi:hypothetical protein N9X60_02500 [Paracoccaceae bacterium]|nr:hypothetical protein [Paracoccaceae bacterium]
MQFLSRFAVTLALGFNAELGVYDYAVSLDVSSTHLIRICHEITGRTALALINEIPMTAPQKSRAI